MIARDPVQTSQRVKVGMIGLAAVLLLIGLAAAIFSTASHDRPFFVAGGARPDVVANMVTGNVAAATGQQSNEPLAEIGVAPSTATESVDVAQISNRIDAKNGTAKP